jgi:uncharacterized protein YbaP (TraB family)
VLFRIDVPTRPASWAFATLRSSDPRVTLLPPVISDALAASRQFAPEMPLAPAVMPGFATDGQFDDGRRLSDHFDAPTLERIRLALGSAAPPPAVLNRLKPWAVLLLLRDPGRDADGPTLDALLLERARQRRMAIVGLELAEEQVASLETFPMASQVTIIRHTLDHLADLPAQRESAVDAWLARDLAALARLAGAPANAGPAVAPHFREQARHLVQLRSVQMAHRLYLPLRSGGVFIAVGAPHLPGREGLLAMIREQGYRIRRVD